MQEHGTAAELVVFPFLDHIPIATLDLRWIESCLLPLVEVELFGKVTKMLQRARNVGSRLRCNEDDITAENVGEYSVINVLPSDR